MNLFSSFRSRMSGQTTEAFGTGERFPVTKQMATSIKSHMNGLINTDLSTYTFERRRSDYPDSKSDIVVYDPEGQVILHGREGSNGKLSFWSI
jgi:hypothetical protein